MAGNSVVVGLSNTVILQLVPITSRSLDFWSSTPTCDKSLYMYGNWLVKGWWHSTLIPSIKLTVVI